MDQTLELKLGGKNSFGSQKAATPGILEKMMTELNTTPEGRMLQRLVEVLQILGWTDLADIQTLAPREEPALAFIQRYIVEFSNLFPEVAWSKVKSEQIVDVLNPLLYKHWRIQIVGTAGGAKLQRYTSVPKDVS